MAVASAAATGKAREEIEKKRDSPNFERWLRKKYSFPYEALLSLPAIADASALYDGSETGIARPSVWMQPSERKLSWPRTALLMLS